MELDEFTKPESPADVFSLRYGGLNWNEDDREWYVCKKAVARREIENS